MFCRMGWNRPGGSVHSEGMEGRTRIARLLKSAAIACAIGAAACGGPGTSRGDDAGDAEADADAPGGCDQELPTVYSDFAAECGDHGPDHCVVAGCPACHVCIADVVCDPPGEEPRACECCGDGSCAKLCDDDSDCSAGEACRHVWWFQFYDSYSAGAWACWPTASRDSVCP